MSNLDIFLQWLTAGIVVLVLLARGRLTLFHPITVYLVFHVIVFCLRPTLVHYLDFDSMWTYMRIAPRPAEMRLALMLSSAGLLIFTLAFLITSRRRSPLKSSRPRTPSDEDRRAFYATAVIFVPLGIYSLFAINAQIERVGNVVVARGPSGFVSDLHQVLIPLTILFMVVSRWRWWSYLPFLGYVHFRAVYGLDQSLSLLSFFLLILVWLWDNRRNFPSFKIIIPASVILLVFLIESHDGDYFPRPAIGEASPVMGLDTSPTLKERWDGPEFANFDSLTYIVTAVPRKSKTFTYGAQYLQFFTVLLPNALWKDGPNGPPIQFLDLNDYGNFVGLTPSLVGDGWMSGGWIGVLATMGIVGAALGGLYTWFTKNIHTVSKSGAFLLINATVLLLFRDGGVSLFRFLLFAMAPLLVLHFFSIHFVRHAAFIQNEDLDYVGDESETSEAGDIFDLENEEGDFDAEAEVDQDDYFEDEDFNELDDEPDDEGRNPSVQ